MATYSKGEPVEIRDTVGLNSDIINNEYMMETTMHSDGERIPERVVHAKGGGAYGYFEVTHDVSKYTKADVFNGIGKKTDIFARFSTVVQNLGGRDQERETKGLAVKFYTKEGNLDLVCVNFPVYFYRDPTLFSSFARSFKRNPRTNLIDSNSRFDFITLRPETLHSILWLLSDYGIPDGYRKMDAFPVHTFEIHNKHGDRYYVRFNFRTEQGLANLTTTEAMAIPDLDYYNRDLYNAIENKNFPSWRLEMDVMSLYDIKHVDYDPFDVIRIWKVGTYKTVTIGRMVLNKNPDNYFRSIEQSAFCPSNLVPGIPGPVDVLFKSRRLAYPDTQNHRLGRNHNKIIVNTPRYAMEYNRDGQPPVKYNMKDIPNYYPNSFNGPVPYVDESIPNEKLILLQSNAVDLEPASNFYNMYVKDEGHRQRLVANAAALSVDVYRFLVKRFLRLLMLTDPDLGRRYRIAVEAVKTAQEAQAILKPVEKAVNA